MLLKTKVGKIRTIVVFNERQKHDHNQPINLDLSMEVTAWLFVRYASKTFIVTHGWVG